MRKFPLVFEAIDPQGRRVALNEEAWRHIQERHGRGLTPDFIKATVTDPDRIVSEPENPETLVYLAYRREIRFYRVVIVKKYEDRDPPFEISSAYPKKLPREGARLWQRPVKP